MKETSERLCALAERIHAERPVRVAILGLGSVGNYLLEYLNNWEFPRVEIVVGCRNVEKAVSDVNIARVSRLIRGKAPKPVRIVETDLDDTASIERFFAATSPDFVVNSSRAYSGLKYGSISWHSIRAYGLWAPLAMKYIRNIMAAHRATESGAVVVNTSYSDAALPWLKSAGMACPDFGSGNLNHLVPRIKLAAGKLFRLSAPSAIEVTLATSHFHDVVISKEGQTEGVEPLLDVSYQGATLPIPDRAALWKDCAIPMPVDAKRNMMNASSNYEIISKIVETIALGGECFLHSPGVGGCLGGYPVRVAASGTSVSVEFDERFFSLADMRAVNRRSIALDGVENVENGSLFWTEHLAAKVRRAFGVDIPREVPYDAIPETADFLVSRVIEPALARAGK